MAGTSLRAQHFTEEIIPQYYSVKEAVFPFAKFQGVDPILGPEMKSTGEVMGVGDTFADAFGRAALGAGEIFPTSGKVFVSVKDVDKLGAIAVCEDLTKLGFTFCATIGTARSLRAAGIEVQDINKVQEGRPHIVDLLKNDEICFIVNTTEGRKAIEDSFDIRRQALQRNVCYTTTVAGAEAIVETLKSENRQTVTKVNRLQDLHARNV